MLSDNELLCRYAASRSEEAFAELVRRHLNLVYFTALRRTNGQAQLAEEVSQAVFITLARQAASLQRHAVLAGWLYVATRHAAAKTMRAEQRRSAREQESFAMHEISSASPSEADWNRLRPELDAVLDEVNERDRAAVLLRFFENRPFAEIGLALGLSEDAARMRVDRTLDKLRALLARRGIASTAAALALALEQPAGAAAPAALAASIRAAVFAGAASATATGLFTFMSSTKIFTGVTSAVALLAASSALYEASRARTSAAYASTFHEQMSAAEARSASLQRELAARKVETIAPPAPPVIITTPPKTPSPSQGRPDDALSNPEAHRLRRQKMEIDFELNTRPFFAKGGFSDEQIGNIKAILLNESEKEMDVGALGRAQGLSTREQEALIANDAMAARANLLALIGDDANKQLIQWNSQLMPLRNFAGELAGKLAFTDEPLTSRQAELYLKVLTDNQRSLGRTSRDGPFVLPEEVMTQLQAILSPSQFALLQQQQLAHQTEREMAALARK